MRQSKLWQRKKKVEKTWLLYHFWNIKTLIPISVQIWWQPGWAVHDTINKGVSRTHQSLIETVNQPSYSSIKIVNPVFHKHSTGTTKIFGNPLVAWKHYYMQHAFACIVEQCNCTTSGKYTNYHNKRKTIVFSHQLNSNWMYAIAYLLYHKKNVTGVLCPHYHPNHLLSYDPNIYRNFPFW